MRKIVISAYISLKKNIGKYYLYNYCYKILTQRNYFFPDLINSISI